MRTFVLDYTVFFTDGSSEDHTMKIRNCNNEFHAKVRLDDYLRKKHDDFLRVEISKSKNDLPPFDDIFGFSNPFGW